MNKTHSKKALTALFQDHWAQQTANSHEQQPRINDDRLKAVLQGAIFNKEERGIMRDSALTRVRFAMLAQINRANTLQAWQQQDLQPEIIAPLAAGDDQVRREDLSNDDYSVAFIPHNAQGSSWEITVTVHNPAYYHSNGLKLVDETGLTWAAGLLDEQHSFSSSWLHEYSPLQQLQQHHLHLMPL